MRCFTALHSHGAALSTSNLIRTSPPQLHFNHPITSQTSTQRPPGRVTTPQPIRSTTLTEPTATSTSTLSFQGPRSDPSIWTSLPLLDLGPACSKILQRPLQNPAATLNVSRKAMQRSPSLYPIPQAHDSNVPSVPRLSAASRI